MSEESAQPEHLETQTLRSDALNSVRGMLMGAADVIPGVSGGTVAIIVRIYERLVRAISRIDMHLLRCVKQRRWRDAAAHMDLRFLLSLGFGIVAGYLLMTIVVHKFLDTSEFTRSLAYAAFSGMILASGILVIGLVKQTVAKTANPDASLFQAIGFGVSGVAVSCCFALYAHSSLDASAPGYGYLFMCGVIAICAMILPGISGAMVLVLLGPYEHVIGTIRSLLKFENIGPGLLTVAVFGAGCAIGLVSFSKVLRRLLTRFPAQTIALLCGFMFGALPMLWPFQHQIVKPKTGAEHYQRYWPETFTGQEASVVATVIAAALFVFAVDRIARHHQRRAHTADSSSPHSKNTVDVTR